MDSSQPIGVLDSGLGGLSVLQAIRRRLPAESFLYCADGGYFPYGVLNEAVIRERVLTLAQYLAAHGAKLIVVACNTATAAAVHEVRAHLALPVVAVEPAVKPAAAMSRSRRIAVLATPHTLASARLAMLLETHARHLVWYTDPCHGWVQQVEQGELTGPATQALVEAVVVPLLRQGVDTLILGCTHFPFLRDTITAVAGPEVNVLDSGAAVARQVGRVLDEYDLQAAANSAGGVRFWTTGDPAGMEAVLGRLGWRGTVFTCPEVECRGA